MKKSKARSLQLIVGDNSLRPVQIQPSLSFRVFRWNGLPRRNQRRKDPRTFTFFCRRQENANMVASNFSSAAFLLVWSLAKIVFLLFLVSGGNVLRNENRA